MAIFMDPGEWVASVARGYVGKDFHPGVQAQCAPFVRQVFADAHVAVANAAHPSDELLNANDGLNPNFADSFAGDDVGPRISSISDAKPGDIVMFKNTYGNWKDGVITHVGIYIGNNQMVHRPTS